ncbi:MAG: PEP-CTERM sorting domain-containing protein [Planctomycetota bacterium]
MSLFGFHEYAVFGLRTPVAGNYGASLNSRNAFVARPARRARKGPTFEFASWEEHMKRHALTLMFALGTVPSVAADNQVPRFDAFGPFPNATFAGSGIPNDEVAASQQFFFGPDDAYEVRIALSASQRFDNPTVTPGVSPLDFGKYFAPETGSNTPSGTSAEGAKWNFNFYAEVSAVSGTTPTDPPLLTDLQFNLLIDFDPAAETPLSELGVIDLSLASTFPPIDPDTRTTTATSDIFQDSQNLLFFNGVPANAAYTPPAFPSFDPDAPGEYTFVIEVLDLGGFAVESVGIDVIVVPEPASLILVAAGLAACGLRRRA